MTPNKTPTIFTLEARPGFEPPVNEITSKPDDQLASEHQEWTIWRVLQVPRCQRSEEDVKVQTYDQSVQTCSHNRNKFDKIKNDRCFRTSLKRL